MAVIHPLRIAVPGRLLITLVRLAGAVGLLNSIHSRCSDEACLQSWGAGAEGFAHGVTGGRSGKIVHVTSLNNMGPGTLR